MPRRLPSDPDLQTLARRLRRRMTKSERRLWSRLRSRQILGYRFHRQYVIGRYIVDFYCRPLLLAVEVDGLSHDAPDAAASDAHRQAVLEARGITVLRFPSGEVMNDLDNVLRSISGCVEALASGRSS
jgi:very-short-patch-repair endonuclease